MIEALAKTIESLRISYLWKAFFLSTLITVIIFAGLIGVTIYALGLIDIAGGGWISSIIAWFGSGAAFVFSWFLFPVTLPLITYIFLDRVADEVEKEFHFSILGTPPSLMQTLPANIKLIAVLIVLNILVLPLYFVPVVNIFIYYLLNGYLLGREFFELICLRHKTRAEARQIRKRHRFTIIGAGVLIVLAATTPILNLFTPVLATVYMVHIYHHIIR